MSTNEERIERAESALQNYVLAKGEAFERSSDEIVDLIADLMHLASKLCDEDITERSPEAVINAARMHYEAEIDGEG